MTCRANWVRKGNKSVTIKIKPTAGSNPAPKLIELGRRVTNRDTGQVSHKNYSASQLAAGVKWNLAPRRIYEMVLVVSPVGASVDVEITIGSKTVAKGQCTRRPFPVTGRWKITTF